MEISLRAYLGMTVVANTERVVRQLSFIMPYRWGKAVLYGARRCPGIKSKGANVI